MISSDSKASQDNGIVIEDKDGNQFVWIPVASISDYKRTDFGKQEGVYSSGTYSNYSETLPTDEQSSITNYHGYYIGRYEAGDKESTDSKIMRSSSLITNTVTIKKGQAPYNLVTRDQAKALAEGVKAKQGYIAKTKLCSSYAWDTAINFIQKTVANYGTMGSTQENCVDTTFTYTDITGITRTKAANSWVLTPTGQTVPVCNIYDMAGNDFEWTTEISSNPSYTCTFQGGACDYNHEGAPAGYRSINNTGAQYTGIGFRVALFI